jgi:hypothetical protein
MAALIYTLCMLAAALCAGLLIRAYIESRSRILFWSGICFAGLTINNLLVVADKIALPNIDLSILRNSVALISMVLLIYGLISEAI